jgi:hypothetical protein
VIKKDPSPRWNEEFAFLVEDPGKDKLVIQVFSWDPVGKHELIGKHGVKLEKLVQGKQTEQHVRVQAAGEVTVNVTALDFGEPSSDGEDDFSGEKLVVVLNNAENILTANGAPTTSCFAKVILGDAENVSSMRYNTCNPEWKETFLFQAIKPGEEYLRIELYDKDSGVEPLGKCSVFTKSLFRGKANDAWIPVLCRSPKDGLWYPSEEGSRLHLILCPLGFGKIGGDSPTVRIAAPGDLIQEELAASTLQDVPYVDDVPPEEEETENSVEIEVVEAFGGRYANLKATDPFIRLTVGNTVGMTDTQQKSFRHPRWYEKFVFPIQDIEDFVYVELLNADDLIADCEISLRKVTNEVADMYLVMFFDQNDESGEGQEAPKVHLKVRGLGPHFVEEAPPSPPTAVKPPAEGKPSAPRRHHHREHKGHKSKGKGKTKKHKPRDYYSDDENEYEGSDEDDTPRRDKRKHKKDQDFWDNSWTGKPKKKVKDHPESDGSDDDSENGWTDAEIAAVPDWRAKLPHLPKSPAQMVWLRVLVYLVSTQKPLTYGEYRMLRLTHKELSKEGKMTVAPQTIERTLREWVTRREALHAAETGSAVKTTGPMKSLGHGVHSTMDLSAAIKPTAAQPPKMAARPLAPNQLYQGNSMTMSGSGMGHSFGGYQMAHTLPPGGVRSRDLPPL